MIARLVNRATCRMTGHLPPPLAIQKAERRVTGPWYRPRCWRCGKRLGRPKPPIAGW